MPLPRGTAELIVTAKPGRSSWAAEEVTDTLLYVDPDAEVVQTKFEGVLIARLKTDVTEVIRVIKRFEYAFISFITPVIVRCVNASRDEVISVISRAAEKLAREGSQVALRAKLRGRSKEVLSESLIEKVIASMGIKLSRRAGKILAVEGVDDYLGVGYGITRSCGVGCTLVDLDELTII
jgi:tRNA(Ser,Leu) C12 N-acetylase TAN1